jgi:hypothetical protein
MPAGRFRENNRETKFRAIFRELEQRLVHEVFEGVVSADIDNECKPGLDGGDIVKFCSDPTPT